MVFVLAAYAQELKLCPLVGCPTLAHHMGILNGFQYGSKMKFKIIFNFIFGSLLSEETRISVI